MVRFMKAMPADAQAFRMPQYSVVDYMITRGPHVKSFLELKIRKEPLEKVKSYGGLMLKHRKIVELAQLQDTSRAEVWVVFVFDNGIGEILAAKPVNLLDLPLEDPPRRRNYRGLATDEEPVCYLDWDTHLTWWGR